MSKQRRNSTDHRHLYKRNSISRSPDETIKRRVALNETLRRKHREQLITAKRFRNLTRQEEYESTGEEEPEDEKNENDEDISPYYRLTKAQVEGLSKDLNSDQRNVRVFAAQHISKFVLEPAQALIKFITEGNCIEALTRMLSSADIEEKIEAAQTISNIAAGPYDLWIKSTSTVPYLISLLNSDNMNLREIAAGALGNMAAEDLGDMNDEDDKVRETIRNNGAIKPLIRMLDSNDTRLVTSACFALANLARGEEAQLKDFFTTKISDKLLKNLENEETATEVCWVISYLTAGSESFRREIMQKEFAAPLVKSLALLAEQGPVVLPVLRTLGNLVATDEYLETIAEHDDFLPNVLKLVRSDQSRALKKEALWVLSNVTSTSNNRIIEKLQELDAIKSLSELVLRGAFDIRKGAAYCIMNIANHGAEYLSKLKHKELLPAFLELLKSQDADMMRLALGYIELLLTQLPNGKEIIENVPDCMEALAAVAPAPDPELYDFANRLVDQYYNESPDMQE
ncbi:armadillo-type protein [Mycotypha africana]|uniref:armadillo-type protein n=1 Tax=Mycotypha africana TaxID=64632 RepID=UPI002301ACB8|nr:armadillo-type protein [Mycotypha africana]KAI8987684.1 armadillo-type protein [Mycotypha africana]